jgi:hypothetical protein
VEQVLSFTLLVIAWTFNFNHPNLSEDAKEFKKIIIEQAAGMFSFLFFHSVTYLLSIAANTHPEIVKLAELTEPSGILPYRQLHYDHPLNGIEIFFTY